MRTYVYIDGFNLYYGALKGTPYKWLDVKALFKAILRPENELNVRACPEGGGEGFRCQPLGPSR